MVNRTSWRQGSVITKMSCWIFVQLQAQARVRELHRDLQAQEIQAKQEKKEKKKRKKAAEQQNSEPTVAVKAADMDPEQENHPEQTEVVPPPAKKLKRSQAVSYASADIEAFFQSATTTAPDVQNPGIKFMLPFVISNAFDTFSPAWSINSIARCWRNWRAWAPSLCQAVCWKRTRRVLQCLHHLTYKVPTAKALRSSSGRISEHSNIRFLNKWHNI